MIYIDSGILVKTYLNEPDSQQWRDRLRVETELVSSTLAIVEVKSAIRQNLQRGLVTTTAANRIWDDFFIRATNGALLLVPMSSQIVDGCVQILGELNRKFALRTLDALHLATAQGITPCTLATTDARMRAAAEELQIPLF